MSDEKKFLSMEDIETFDDIHYDEIPVWGGILRIGSLNADDMIAFHESNEGPAAKTAAIRLIVKSMVDAQGNRIGTPKHIQMLGKKDSATIAQVTERILALNKIGLTQEQIAAAKNVSGEALSGASPSVLH